MSTAIMRGLGDTRKESGMGASVLLHLLVAGGIVAAVYFGNSESDRWGGSQSTVGAIQASMVSAIPLPQKAPPVKDQVLAPDTPSVAPTPPPKEATQPPPKPTDIEVKAPTKTVKVAPRESVAPPKHPQPTPPTPKATTGESATQIPEALAQARNGTATMTVQDRTFGVRYAYYMNIMQRAIGEAWHTQDADPRSSMGKSVVLTFEVGPDGMPFNPRIQTPSGSPTLDATAMQALERVDGFGPNPVGHNITVMDTFAYHP